MISLVMISLVRLVAAVLLFSSLVTGQEVSSANQEAAIVRGIVHDSTGKLVRNARVILVRNSLRSSEQPNTDAAGRFAFLGVATGKVTITATLGSLRSAAVSLV